MIFIELPSGQTVERQDIKAFITEEPADRYIYLMAGTHGDEIEGIFVLQKLFSWLQSNHDITSLPIVVLPVLNVDGVQRETRTNAHGVDLNRNMPTKDWTTEHKSSRYFPGEKALSEPENKFIANLFQQYPPRLIISFHTWKPILNFDGSDAEPIAKFLGAYNNYKVQDYIGYPTPGSLGTFVKENYQGSVLTFECPEIDESKSLNDIWKENEEGLKKLFERDFFQASI